LDHINKETNRSILLLSQLQDREIKSSVSHIYRNHCDGKHLNIGRNPLAKDERFYPWMMKEDTAAEHLD
jgi:hypothetical protein